MGRKSPEKILTGVLEADEGTILYRGKPLKINHPREIHDHGIGIVYQEFNLLPTGHGEKHFHWAGDTILKGFINDSRLNKGCAPAAGTA